MKYLEIAPRDGTYIEVTTPMLTIIRNVYWCDEAKAWAQDGRTFNPPLSPATTWRYMADAP